MTTTTKYTPLICIGLGLSGICLGAQLKRKYGLKFADMHFYERNESHGGTWWVNRYPGEIRWVSVVGLNLTDETKSNRRRCMVRWSFVPGLHYV